MSKLSLGDEFPQPSHEDWLGLVEKTLKGADFDKRLVSHTEDGIRVEPLYFGDEIADSYAVQSGHAPFRRGAPDAQNSIRLCQSFSHPNLKQTNAEILEDIANGVTAIRLKIDDGDTGGIALQTPADLERVLEGVYLDMIPVELDAGKRGVETAEFLLDLWKARGLQSSAQGAFLIDPVNTPNIEDIEAAMKRSALLAKDVAAQFPGVTSLCADMRRVHLNGASDAQEIAIAAATGLAYLRSLEQQKVALDVAAGQISFILNVDADVFAAIAKLRGFREIWARITGACGIAPQTATIKAETAKRMMVARDVHVNMLRTTTACFAACVAGAQSITIAPYTDALGLPDGFGRRIARNTQIVLSEESGLGRVADPAGGSWFIENLTDQLIEKAWGIFQQIETEGGIVAALEANFVQDMIATATEQRNKDVATRKHVLVGVNEFANLSEEPA